MRVLILALASAALSGCMFFGGDDEPPGGPAALDAAAQEERVRVGFVSLGASEARSACFAEQLSKRLDQEGLTEAAEMLEASEGSGDMRSAVLGGGMNIKGAFTAANFACAMVR